MNSTQATTEPRVSTLVNGIVHDLEELVKQQLALFRSEMKSEVHKARDLAIPLGLGVWGILLGLAAFCLTLVHLLQWATSMPLWACYLIVGIACVVVGGGLVYVGKKQLDSFNPLPEESARALKENVQCLLNPK
jgi:hypothetical protein